MRYYKDIEAALKHERQTDVLIKKLSNKFAIVKSLYTNGKYSGPSICGLENNKIVFYGSPKNFIQWFKNKGAEMPKISYSIIAFYSDPQSRAGTIYRRVTNDNRPYIKRQRKLYYLLTS